MQAPTRLLRRSRSGPRSCTRCSKASRSSTSARAGCTRTAATSTCRRAGSGSRRPPSTRSAELLKPAYAHWVDLATRRRSGSPITVPGWADVVDVATITEPEHLDALDCKLIWSRDYVESRFSWKRRDPLWVLVLRVHRLDEPLTRAVARRVRRLHVVGRPTTACPPTPATLAVARGPLRRRVRGQAQRRPRGAPGRVLAGVVAQASASAARARAADRRSGR